MRRLALACALAMLLPFASGAQEALKPLAPKYEVSPEIQLLLDVAAAELGYQENRDGTTKYGAWAGNPAAQWCAEYLCWSVDQVDRQRGTSLLKSQYPLYGASNVGRDWFLRQGRYNARRGIVPDWGSQWFKGESAGIGANGYVPEPGDWVFFSYGAGGDTSHVAMVETAVLMPDGSTGIQVLEGNNPSAVARMVYALSDWRIQGYGTVRDLADIVLRMGAQGEKVRALQAVLREAELLADPDVTGFYSQRTSDAVKVFQGMMSFTTTGIANQATQLALQEYILTWRQEHVGYFTVQDGI